MEFSVIPYRGDPPKGAPDAGGYLMPPWPALAEKAFCLQTGPRKDETLFFYDSSAGGRELSGGDASPAGNAGSSAFSGAAPLVMLIHGLVDEADSWRHIIPLLNAEGCRTLAPDLPGFGRSVTPDKISLKKHIGAVLALLDAATRPAPNREQGAGLSPREKPAETRSPREKPAETRGEAPAGETGNHPPRNPVFLAGNSMGALIAEAVAFERPQLVKGIILLDGTIPGGPPMPGLFALAKLLFSRKWYRAYRDNPEAAWGSLYPYYADLNAMPEEDREFLKTRVMARVRSPAQERAFFQTQRSLVWFYMTAAAGFAKKIRNCEGKIRLLWGDADKIIPVSSARAFWLLRNDIELEMIGGAGHLPQQENPRETARLMVNFIRAEGG